MTRRSPALDPAPDPALSPSVVADWARVLSARGLEPRLSEPLAKHGFWRLGGPTDLWVELPTVADLAAVLALGAPLTIVGNGSNLLVADAGIRGITARLTGQLRDARLPGPDELPPIARVGAGMLNTVLLSRMKRQGLGGLGCLAGVPGTMGGAVRMNAGTGLGEVGAQIVNVELLLADGTPKTLGAEQLRLAYRRAELPPGSVLTWIRLRLLRDPVKVQAEAPAIARHLARRKATQPLDQPSCGSVFRNPPGDAAGRLLEQAGLKGLRQGGAQISEKHANFIVNTGGATAEDCWWLITTARARVWRDFSVLLEPEVHAVGDWPDGYWPLPQPSAESSQESG